MNQPLRQLVLIFGGLVVFCLCFPKVLSATGQPNFIFIVADDLGWNDVGFHGSNQIPTPNIDAMAYNGIILNSHYSQSFGTPSLTALLTGKYPMRLGMQGPSTNPGQPRALPEGKLLPDHFRDLGYATHLIGKWHMGHARWNDTPTLRGFDHFLGYYAGFTSYRDFVSTWRIAGREYSGFDLRRDTAPARDLAGAYATELFAREAADVVAASERPFFILLNHLAVHAGNEGKYLEAPQAAVDKLGHIVDPNRRTYAAMVAKLDESVGTVFKAVEDKGLLQNTVIVLISDNGAPTAGAARNWGSNHPLRGVKDTLFEGGVRTVACVYSPLLAQSARVSADLFHVTDWLPTLLAAAGGDAGELDGVDQWPSLAYDLPSPRTDVLLNIDERTRNAALRFYNWKLIVGTSQNGSYNGYFGAELRQNRDNETAYNVSAVLESQTSAVVRKAGYAPIAEREVEALRAAASVRCLAPGAKRSACDPASGAVCLYDIPNDPCEENDLAKFFPSVVRRMKRALVDYRKGLVGQIESEVDIERADPANFQFTWNPWLDCSDSTCTS